MSDYDVLVIGAGAAGIAAARCLQQQGLSVQVLEASRELGGRAHSERTSFGYAFDCGAHWFHSPADNPLRIAADALGVTYANRPYPAHWYRDGALLSAAENADCTQAIEDGFARIAALGKAAADRPAAAALAPDAPWAPAMAAEFTAKQGVAPARGSCRDFARYQWTGEDLPLVDGFGELLRRLAHGLPIALDSPVTQVDWRDARGVQVHGPRGTLRARRVIVTASTGVLASGVLQFLPTLPARTQEAIHRLPMGHCNKLALAFKQPVFEDVGQVLLVPAGPDAAPLELLLRPAGQALAVAIVSGEFGRALAAAGLDAARDLVLGQLVSLFGAAITRALAPSQRLVNWDAAPWVRGYVAAPGPGDADARAWLAEPVGERIFFAGEATSLTAMGDAHGAWRSGEAAAAAAARGLI